MFLGSHAIMDLEFDQYSEYLSNPTPFLNAMRESILHHGATILKEDCHQFPHNGCGFTFTFILAESHASCHTWPEYGMATLDIYMCGEADSFLAMERFISNLRDDGAEIKRKTETKIFRGWVEPLKQIA